MSVRPLTTAAIALGAGAVLLHTQREDALAQLVMICGVVVAAADVVTAILEPKEK